MNTQSLTIAIDMFLKPLGRRLRRSMAWSSCLRVGGRKYAFSRNVAAFGAMAVLPIAVLVPGRVATADPNPALAAAAETPAQHDARMEWWRAAKFGMFIHWGNYSHLGGVWHGKQVGGYGEWIMHTGKIPVKDYVDSARDFNPVGFDAEQWVSIARSAGMKYIVFTAKHHDGFAMYRSKVSPINIYDATPFKRDPVAELAKACHKGGLKFGLYYSQAQDWTHPGGATRPHGDGSTYWDPAQQGDPANPPVLDAYGRVSSALMDQYIDTVAVPQLRELLTNYGPIAEIWFDTGVGITHDRAEKFLNVLKLQPQIIVNNRLVDGDPLIQGDFDTPEQFIPTAGIKSRDWETCMTINDTWGYVAGDNTFKSTEVLQHNLVDVVSKGGNFLLNVGPDGNGVIPQPEVQRLEEIGAWMKVNSDSIYGTSASPLYQLPDNERMTVKGDTYFLHVFNWNGNATVPGLETDVASARTLADNESLAVSRDADGVINIAPPTHPDPLDTVIVLKLKGPLQVVKVVENVAPAADGSFLLKASDAATTGTIRLEGSDPDANLGFWGNATDTAAWTVLVPADHDYKVSLTYALDQASDGTAFELRASPTSTVSQTLAATKSWGDYSTITLTGTLHLAQGKQTITLVPTKMPGQAVMNLKSIVLTPSPSV